MIAACSILLATITSANAIATVLNSPSAVGPAQYAHALDLVEREARDGKPLQQFVIGITTKDKTLAKRYIEASGGKIMQFARERNNALAWYLLAVERNDLKLLRRAADGGNVQALNALGAMATEKSMSRDIAPEAREKILRQSFDYFSKAVEKNDPNGFINLGTCYLQGLGCKQDLAMAFLCFRNAAEAGHPEGMENLSAAYELGHGTEKNPRLSLFWRMKARAVRGDEAAIKWLKEGK